MDEIRGTGNKSTVDWVNEPVRKWGLPSFTLAFVFVGFVGTGLIFAFLLGVFVILYLLIYAFVVVRITKWMQESQKKGIDNPLGDRFEFNAIPKKITQQVDIKAIYESKRSR